MHWAIKLRLKIMNSCFELENGKKILNYVKGEKEILKDSHKSMKICLGSHTCGQRDNGDWMGMAIRYH